MFSDFDAKNFFTHLRSIAKQDLSKAHILQHEQSATLTLAIAGMSRSGPGAWSSMKQTDGVVYQDQIINGKKVWVSNLLEGKWAVFQVTEHAKPIIVMVDFDATTTFETIPTLGLEDTHTGNIIFQNTPAIKICDKDDLSYFQVQQLHHFGFVTNHLAVCEALFEDVDNYTKLRNINNNYSKQKVLVELSALKLLWEYNLNKIEQITFSDVFWHERNTLFALAKKTLIDVCQLFLEHSFNDAFIVGNQRSQMYKDAVLYTTHMKNLYSSAQEVLY